MPACKVTSEIYAENNDSDSMTRGSNRISKFTFKYPPYLIKRITGKDELLHDEDGDLVLNRRKEGTLLIEHCISTELQLVGLQLWRGAFLQADFILANPDMFMDKSILELGSGVGLTSVVASILAKRVICTDLNMGGILRVIRRNFDRNHKYVKGRVHVTELNFLDLNWSRELREELKTVDIIMAADVIYDDSITDGFVKTLDALLDSKQSRVAYIALEKRFVFTITDLDSVAPMYEEFLRCITRNELNWTIEEVELGFSQFFQYERLKQMILLKIQKPS